MTKKLLKGGLAMVGLRVFSMALFLVMQRCLTFWMSPSEMASYLAGTNVLILVSLIGMGGLNQSMLRLIAGKKNTTLSDRELLWKCWKIAVVFSVLITGLFAVLLRTSFGTWMKCDPEIIAPILTCSLLVSVHKLMASSLRSVHALASSSILEGRSGGPLSNTAYFLILLGAFASGLNAKTALWVFAAALAGTAPIGFYMLRKALAAGEVSAEKTDHDKTDGDGRDLETRTFVIYSLPFLFTILLGYFATEFDVLIASAYTSPSDTALFGTARRLIIQTLAPIQILTVSAAASIAQLHASGDRERLGKMLRYSATIGSFITIPLLAVCLMFPRLILSTVFGEFYGDGATIFVILGIGPIFNCLTGQCLNLLMLYGRAKPVLVTKIVAAILMVVVGSFAAKEFGIIGLAITTTTISALQNIALWLIARVTTGLWTHPSLRLRKPKIAKPLS